MLDVTFYLHIVAHQSFCIDVPATLLIPRNQNRCSDIVCHQYSYCDAVTLSNKDFHEPLLELYSFLIGNPVCLLHYMLQRSQDPTGMSEQVRVFAPIEVPLLSNWLHKFDTDCK